MSLIIVGVGRNENPTLCGTAKTHTFLVALIITSFTDDPKAAVGAAHDDGCYVPHRYATEWRDAALDTNGGSRARDRKIYAVRQWRLRAVIGDLVGNAVESRLSDKMDEIGEQYGLKDEEG